MVSVQKTFPAKYLALPKTLLHQGRCFAKTLLCPRWCSVEDIAPLNTLLCQRHCSCEYVALPKTLLGRRHYSAKYVARPKSLPSPKCFSIKDLTTLKRLPAKDVARRECCSFNDVNQPKILPHRRDWPAKDVARWKSCPYRIGRLNNNIASTK